MNHKITVEVCCGSVEDCVKADAMGADRIELNTALVLGGLTPSLGMLAEAKRKTKLPIVTMVRSRAGGFHYNDYEKQTMLKDAGYLIEAGAKGIVFGFLNVDGTIDQEATQKLVKLCHKHKVEAIFHRAFDQVPNAFVATETLIACGVDRILTSGLKERADEGIPLLYELNQRYGDKMEFCMGGGIDIDNIERLLRDTGMTQVHASFKGWFSDPTTTINVSYQYSEFGDYDGVDEDKLRNFLQIVRQ